MENLIKLLPVVDLWLVIKAFWASDRVVEYEEAVELSPVPGESFQNFHKPNRGSWVRLDMLVGEYIFSLKNEFSGSGRAAKKEF